MTMDEQRRPILATARELYGRVVYSHKTHEKEREIWGAKVRRMNHINICLTSATTFFAIISAALKPSWSIYLTAVFALLTVCFVMWQSNFDPAGKENQHRVTAKELLWIREQLLLLITESHIPESTQKHLERCLEILTRELTAVYKFAPNTTFEAYSMADKSIKSGHFTFSDEEIDLLLPTHLRQSLKPSAGN